MVNCSECSGSCSGMTKEEALASNDKMITDNLKKFITDHSYHSPRISSEFCDCGTPLSLDIYNLCVFEDEKVLVRGNNRVEENAIKNIKIGDKVLSYNHKNNKFEFKEVKEIFNREVEELYEIETESGKKMLVTKEHPIFINNSSYLDAENVEVGDEVLVFDKGVTKFEKVKNIKIINKKARVCNLSVKGTENFFVNNILTHNCSGKCQYCLHGDTDILTRLCANQNKKKNIKIRDIKIGDEVLTYNEKIKKIESNKVKKVMDRIADSYYILKVNKKEIKITGEHPVYTRKGWIEVKDLKKGDEVLWAYGKHPSVSEYMKKNNPMFKKETRDKVSETSKRIFRENKEKGILHFNTGRKRPDLSKYMRKHNPSKKESRRKEISETISKHMTEKMSKKEERDSLSNKMKVLIKEGKHHFSDKELCKEKFRNMMKIYKDNDYIPKGELKIKKELDRLGIKFIHRKKFRFGKGRGEVYEADFYLPEYNILVESDGFFHKRDKVKNRDIIRDKWFLSKGIKTLRITSNRLKAKYFNLREAINEIRKD